MLDEEPYAIPRHYMDIHIRSQLKESVQILCDALHGLGVKGLPYKPYNINGPCAKWARETYHNWCWLNDLAHALGGEHIRRFNKRHKSCEAREELTRIDIKNQKIRLITPGWMTCWPQVMPDKFKINGCTDEKCINGVNIGETSEDSGPCLHKQDCITAYRNYYAHKIREFRLRGIAKRSTR